MSSRVRVLVRRAQSAGGEENVYSAEVFDDSDTHAVPLWACNHPHRSQQAAHECALEWLARVRRMVGERDAPQ